MKISIITITHNSAAFLDKYFLTIFSAQPPGLEIILVDNGSKDQTVNIIKKYQEKEPGIIKLIRENDNKGFAASNNKGAGEASGDLLFFLNPDTKLGKDCLLLIAAKVKSLPKDFILAPRQKTYDEGKFILDGVCTDIFTYPYKIYHADEPLNLKPAFYVDGAALIVPTATFKKLGLFDTGLFMFNEDVDFSWKAHIFDIPLIFLPEAVVYHFSGGSMKGGTRKGKVYETTYSRRYLSEKNTIRNFLKNYSWYILIWLLPIYLIINIFEIIIFGIFAGPRVSRQYLKSWYWNLKNLKSTLLLRKTIQRQRKVADWVIVKNMYWGSGKFNIFKSIRIPKFS